jgi:RNA polymerase sigma-70 factor (ECF subfamily)
VTQAAVTPSLASPERAAVERARAGDADAFASLVDRRIDALFRTAVAILRDEADARDAVQETLVGAWRELPALRDVDRFDAWLGRSLVNRCRSALRSRSRRRIREISAADEMLPDRGDPGGGMADTLSNVDAIRRAFDRLSAAERTVLVLHHVEQRPIAEIAPLLGVAPGTVKWRLHEARRALQHALAGEDR